MAHVCQWPWHRWSPQAALSLSLFSLSLYFSHALSHGNNYSTHTHQLFASVTEENCELTDRLPLMPWLSCYTVIKGATLIKAWEWLYTPFELRLICIFTHSLIARISPDYCIYIKSSFLSSHHPTKERLGVLFVYFCIHDILTFLSDQKCQIKNERTTIGIFINKINNAFWINIVPTVELL